MAVLLTIIILVCIVGAWHIVFVCVCVCVCIHIYFLDNE